MICPKCNQEIKSVIYKRLELFQQAYKANLGRFHFPSGELINSDPLESYAHISEDDPPTGATYLKSKKNGYYCPKCDTKITSSKDKIRIMLCGEKRATEYIMKNKKENTINKEFITNFIKQHAKRGGK